MKTLKFSFFILTIACLFSTNEMQAQTVIIGSGTNVNGTQEASPVNIWYRKAVSHFVITQSELLAAGYTGPGSINKLGFFIESAPLYTIPGYTIQMRHTNATSASGLPNGGWTEVRSAFDYSPQAGDWDLITLDSPFAWNGTQNIGIRICWSQVQPTYNASGQCRVTTSANGYEYRWNDGAGSYCGTNPNTMANYKPQVQMMFDTVTVWTGLTNTNWFVASNWTAGVPNERMDAIIPTSVANNPVITSGTAIMDELILQGTLTISANAELEMYGNLTSIGTYNDLGGSMIFAGEGSATLTSVGMDINELRVEKSGTLTIAGSPIVIIDELQVNKSNLNTGDLIVMRSDENGTARIDELKSTCNYTLNMNDSWGDGWNGGSVTVEEDGIEIGNYSAEGASSSASFSVAEGSTLSLIYTSGSWENENTYNLVDGFSTTVFSDGPNPSTGTVFTTTAACPFTPMIVGDITMERYLDAGATYWRYFGSAVEGADLAQFNDDFTTAGYPGSHFPTFPFISAYNYDETQAPNNGYQPASSASQVMQVGEGWQIYCGDTITGTQPFTFDLVGTPNQGPISLPVTYTFSNNPADDGWNMVCNPYASTIDWDAAGWTKTNMANATYIQNPDTQQYATYVAGAGTNGGTRFIASQQSFWVQATGNSPVLNTTEAVKHDGDAPFIKSNEVLSPGMKITLVGAEEYDEIIIRHVDGAADNFEFAYDAEKWWGGWGEYCQFSSINGQNKDLTVNSFDKLDQEWSIPLRAIVFADGTYELKFENINEMDVPCLTLEDTYTGETYQVEEGTHLPFAMDDTTYAPRFILHIGKVYQTEVAKTSCYQSNDGSFSVDLDNAGMVNYTLNTEQGIITGTTSGDPFILENLSTGIYYVEIEGFSGSCGETGFNFVVNQPSPINPNAEIIPETQGGDGEIILNPTGGTAPYDIEWINGVNGPIVTDLSGGTYMVQITDANGCQFETSYSVDSSLGLEDENSDLELYYNPSINALVIKGWQGDENEWIDIYSANGQVIASYQLLAGQQSFNFFLEDKLAAGVYFAQSQSSQIKVKFLVNQN